MRNGKVLYQGKSRLGGTLLHMLADDGVEYFVKTGTEFERSELVREHRNVVAVQNYIHTPTEVWYNDNSFETTLVTQKAPGKPLHEYLNVLDEASLVKLLKDILALLWNNRQNAGSLPIGVEEEIADVKRLMAEDKLDRQDFLSRSNGVEPEELLSRIENEVYAHDADVISHGDFCLPNIILDDHLTWTLIDWGKGGLGDRHRDLASLEGSLKRNGVNDKVFRQLLQELGLTDYDHSSQKMRPYNNLDLFWYSSTI